MLRLSRRRLLSGAAGALAGAACESGGEVRGPTPTDAVLGVEPLGPPPWKTEDPFLFCVHHDDDYPEGDERFGPAAPLDGRDLGQDFAGKDGWRMYHGRVVPGFPQHPHRGFETITVVRRGLLDHADSLGAAARYGQGDVQWLTAGRGIQHAEMFPLLRSDRRNPVELFQIWLNLPAARKLAPPHFTMLWASRIPVLREGGAEITVVAGQLGDTRAPAPPPDSWASEVKNDVTVWTLRLGPGARVLLPARPGVERALYFFRGEALEVGGRRVAAGHRVALRDGPVALRNVGADAELLLLGGRPIGAPVARHGPFVMNSREQIAEAYAAYRTTRFGGWPWERSDPVHGPLEQRFARHADGRLERPA